VSIDKVRANKELVKLVRDCRKCMSESLPLYQPEHEALAAHVSTYALWCGNLDAKVLIVGQDPAGVKEPAGAKDIRKLAPGPKVKTNKMLVRLMEAAGLRPGESAAKNGCDPLPHFPDVYMTNAILCLKQGGMRSGSGKVLRQRASNCGTWLARTISVVAPNLVVALGAHAWSALQAITEATDDGSATSLRLRDAAGAEPYRAVLAPDLLASSGSGSFWIAGRYHPSYYRHVHLDQWRLLQPYLGD